MSDRTEELFVQFVFPCECGTELQVHGEYFVGFRVGGQESVACPKCRKEHALPTRALRVFFREGNAWKVGLLN